MILGNPLSTSIDLELFLAELIGPRVCDLLRTGWIHQRHYCLPVLSRPAVTIGRSPESHSSDTLYPTSQAKQSAGNSPPDILLIWE